jgi:hypothetical protein
VRPTAGDKLIIETVAEDRGCALLCCVALRCVALRCVGEHRYSYDLDRSKCHKYIRGSNDKVRWSLQERKSRDFVFFLFCTGAKLLETCYEGLSSEKLKKNYYYAQVIIS